MVGNFLIRAGTSCMKAATGALVWRKPDPTSSASLWRRAFVWLMIRAASALIRVGVAL